MNHKRESRAPRAILLGVRAHASLYLRSQQQKARSHKLLLVLRTMGVVLLLRFWSKRMPTRDLRRLLLCIWVVALGLFVVGPQMGSIDDDQDGAPDVAIVVCCRCYRHAEISRGRAEAPLTRIPAPRAATVFFFYTRHFAIERFKPSVTTGSPVLSALCILRC
jgi:hypothetical protein